MEYHRHMWGKLKLSTYFLNSMGGIPSDPGGLGLLYNEEKVKIIERYSCNKAKRMWGNFSSFNSEKKWNFTCIVACMTVQSSDAKKDNNIKYQSIKDILDRKNNQKVILLGRQTMLCCVKQDNIFLNNFSNQ